MAPEQDIIHDKWKVYELPNADALFFEHRDLHGRHRLAKTRRLKPDSVPLSPRPQDDKLLQASPYTGRDHLLDFTTLIKPLQHFAKALTGMRAIRPDYATAPYHQSFNWDSIVDIFSQTARSQLDLPASLDFFVIVFRSRINDHADRQLLGELDKAAHVEAVQGGGLLKYWFGTPDDLGKNLATCIWRERQDARRGGAGPGHALAMQAARRMYDEWVVERLRLTVRPGDGSWSFSRWEDEAVSAA